MGTRDLIKALLKRTLRPAIDPALRQAVHDALPEAVASIEARFSAVERALASTLLPVWRGGPDGAIDPPIDPALELAWRDLVRRWERIHAQPDAHPAFVRGFHETLRAHNLARLRALGHAVGCTGDEDLARWCASRSCVECTTSPRPCAAEVRWRWAACVNPLADAYAAIGIDTRAALAPIVARSERPPLPPSCADVVLCVFATDDGIDRAATLRQARRLVRPDGVVCLISPATDPVADAQPDLAQTALRLHDARTLPTPPGDAAGSPERLVVFLPAPQHHAEPGVLLEPKPQHATL